MKPYRLRIKREGVSTYITRDINSGIRYLSATETPLALCNLFGNAAAELRFALEDAKDGIAAAAEIRKLIEQRWRDNRAAAPLLEVLTNGFPPRTPNVMKEALEQA